MKPDTIRLHVPPAHRTRRHILCLALVACLAPACGDDGGGSAPALQTVEDRLATDSQEVHAGALAALRARDDTPIDVLDVVRLRAGGADAYRRFEAAVAPLRDARGATVLIATHVEGAAIGAEDYDEVRVVRYPSAAAYLAMLEEEAYGRAARDERDAVEHKTLLYGPQGILFPVPTGTFANAAFDDLTRDEAAALLDANLHGPNAGEGNREVLIDLIADDSGVEFFMLNLLEYRDVALYPNGEFPGSTGVEAGNRYNAVVLPLLAARNSGPVHLADVEGVLVGDRETWHQFATVRYASPDAAIDMIFDPVFQAGAFHKFASLEATEALVTRQPR